MFDTLSRPIHKATYRPWLESGVGVGGVNTAPVDRTHAEPDTEYTSRSFTPGIAGDVTITGGTYQKNGAGGFVSSAGTALDTDSFELRGTSQGDYSTAETPQETEVTLNINGTDITYTITNMLEPPEGFPYSLPLTLG